MNYFADLIKVLFFHNYGLWTHATITTQQMRSLSTKIINEGYYFCPRLEAPAHYVLKNYCEAYYISRKIYSFAMLLTTWKLFKEIAFTIERVKRWKIFYIQYKSLFNVEERRSRIALFQFQETKNSADARLNFWALQVLFFIRDQCSSKKKILNGLGDLFWLLVIFFAINIIFF